MNTSAPGPLLHVSGLTISFAGNGRDRTAIASPDFDVRAGETVGLVGPSGCGKTVTALAIMGLLPPGGSAAGTLRWRGADLLMLPPDALQKLRGRELALVPQDPMTALHPYMRIDYQVAEAVRAHSPDRGKNESLDIAHELLERTGIARSRTSHSNYPFQWSGGMRQRALIAMAIAHRPALLIADEPTTGLDVTTQMEILRLLKRMLHESGSSMLLITHDADVVQLMADRVITVSHATPRVPPPLRPAARPRASIHTAVHVTAPDLLDVRSLSVRYLAEAGWFGRTHATVHAVEDVSFRLAEGETLAIVGESGCGKSTLARALVGLERPSAGSITLHGQDITRATRRELRALRKNIQIVFQDPFSSLNPRHTAGESIAEPMKIHGSFTRGTGQKRIGELLEQVRLPAAYAARLPHELSGGERQRVAIARAIALEPTVLVLDEPVTALDSETQSAILQLLRSLQEQRGMAFVLIAHDLRLVRSVAHRVAVMLDGRFVEVGETPVVFARPAHSYTRSLIAAMPGGERLPSV